MAKRGAGESDGTSSADEQKQSSSKRTTGQGDIKQEREWKIVYRTGDLFADVPDKAVIVHSTNCIGEWGAGFALALKQRCPAAFKVYEAHCEAANSPQELAGTCLLIDPQTKDYTAQKGTSGPSRWYIACLFTSLGYGRRIGDRPGRSAQRDIVLFTGSALKALREQLDTVRDVGNESSGTCPGQLCSPKFNAGRFAVPWDKTEDLIMSHFRGCERTWTVFCDSADSSSAPPARKRLKRAVKRD